ncbi:MAG: DMT family transporter [Brevundimonas sp.]|uniref:DMT family transporter n=1 Tax=Brevundimonas sp. TaxID=1871086 RepID=UPI00391AC4B5
MPIPPIHPWLALIIAGVLEIAWASGFRFIGFNRPVVSLVVAMVMVLSFYFLWVAVQRLPIGTAYAVWTGIGAVGAAVVGMVLYGEPAGAIRIVSIVLIVAGIVGLKLVSAH